VIGQSLDGCRGYQKPYLISYMRLSWPHISPYEVSNPCLRLGYVLCKRTLIRNHTHDVIMNAAATASALQSLSLIYLYPCCHDDRQSLTSLPCEIIPERRLDCSNFRSQQSIYQSIYQQFAHLPRCSANDALDRLPSRPNSCGLGGGDCDGGGLRVGHTAPQQLDVTVKPFHGEGQRTAG